MKKYFFTLNFAASKSEQPLFKSGQMWRGYGRYADTHKNFYVSFEALKLYVLNYVSAVSVQRRNVEAVALSIHF